MQPTHSKFRHQVTADSPAIRPKTVYAILAMIGFVALGGVLLTPELNEINGIGSYQAVMQTERTTQTKFKVAAIAGKTSEEVEAILGKPISTETVDIRRAMGPCVKKRYKRGQVEIIYIKGKADWLTINLPKSQVDMTGPYMVTKAYDNPGFVYVQVATN